MILLPEQIEDAAIMAAAQDMPNFSKAGTGKTFTTLEAWRLTGIERGLILAPKIALAMWEEEILKTGRTVAVMRAGRKVDIEGKDAVICTYDMAARLQATIEGEFSPTGGVLINDESHYVRNVEAKRTQAVFGKKVDGQTGIASLFDQVWNLTGTPIKGYANDLYTQAALFHKNYFSATGVLSYDSFAAAYTYKRQKQYSPQMPPVWKISGNTNELLLSRILYERIGIPRRTEIKGLPPMTSRVLTVPIKITNEIAKLLKQAKPGDIMSAIHSQDSQLNKVWRYLGLAKVEEALPYIGESADNGPVLLGCWHRDVMQAYYDGLTKMGLTVCQVNGSTKDDDRERIRNRFNAGGVDVLIGQMGAMGVSWNLQKVASHVIIAEEYPSPDVIEQFYKRVYRMGQTERVQVDFLSADCWVDEALRGVRLRKAASDMKING